MSLGVFSPVDNSQEHFVESLLRKHTSDDVTWTLSSDLGYLGILERENATILNESLKGLCKKTISGFRKALSDIGLHCPVFFTQNDGTLIRYVKPRKETVKQGEIKEDLFRKDEKIAICTTFFIFYFYFSHFLKITLFTDMNIDFCG